MYAFSSAVLAAARCALSSSCAHDQSGTRIKAWCATQCRVRAWTEVTSPRRRAADTDSILSRRARVCKAAPHTFRARSMPSGNPSRESARMRLSIVPPPSLSRPLGEVSGGAVVPRQMRTATLSGRAAPQLGASRRRDSSRANSSRSSPMKAVCQLTGAQFTPRDSSAL